MTLPTGGDLIDAGTSLIHETAVQSVYKLGNNEIDNGLSAVLGAPTSASAWRAGLKQLKPANEVGAIGKYMYKEQSDRQGITEHKKRPFTMMQV